MTVERATRSDRALVVSGARRLHLLDQVVVDEGALLDRTGHV